MPNDYQIVLPCDPADFQKFIAGLLGKPQTITRSFAGPFEIDRHDIENFYHLVEQRVQQQNEAVLISLTVTLVYDDRSTVQLNSFTDFQNYNEVRPLISEAVHLSWSFLVKFPDRDVPEKQQIDVSIQTEGFVSLPERGHVMQLMSEKGVLSFRIQHTARTWGADIEALLSGHIETLIKKPSVLEAFINKQAGWVGLALGSLFFLAAVVSTFVATGNFLKQRMALAAEMHALDPLSPAASTKKLDFLVDIVASGVWPRYFFYAASFLVGALIASVLLGIWAGVTAEHKPPSFLLLSKEAYRRKQKLTKENKRYWLSFSGAVVVNIIGGVAANWIFIRYFQGWVLR